MAGIGGESSMYCSALTPNRAEWPSLIWRFSDPGRCCVGRITFRIFEFQMLETT